MAFRLVNAEKTSADDLSGAGLAFNGKGHLHCHFSLADAHNNRASG
jgi:hypothetical protein